MDTSYRDSLRRALANLATWDAPPAMVRATQAELKAVERYIAREEAAKRKER